MDPINASLQPSLSSNESQFDGTLDLLELCWFFDNLLIKRNPRMSTSHSDPCLSKVAHQVFDESSDCNVCSSALDRDVSMGIDVGVRRNLLRTPSLPCRMDRTEGIPEKDHDAKPLVEHGVVVETPVENVCSADLDVGVDVLIRNGGGKCRNLVRMPSLPSRVDREEGVREEGNDSRPLSEHVDGVFVESPADNVCLPALDMDVTPQNGRGKRRSLLRTPSLPTRVEREEGIREKGNGSKLLIEHGLLQKPAKPPYAERKEEGTRSKESGSTRRSKSSRKPRHSNLLRTPSLPPCLGREKEFGEKEVAARIRNAIQPNLSEFFPTRQEVLQKCCFFLNFLISFFMWA